MRHSNSSQNDASWRNKSEGYGRQGNKYNSSREKADKRPQLRLSPTEYEEKKRLGLCFKCDEKFFVGYNCQKKEFRVLLVVNGREIDLGEDGEETYHEEETKEEPRELMELSLNYFLGISSPTTTKIRGTIGKMEFVFMLDSGATHNFISPEVANKAKLKQTYNKKYKIVLGTGMSVKGMGSCRNIPFKLKDLECTVDFITLELGLTDIILGIQWLRTHEISFVYNG